MTDPTADRPQGRTLADVYGAAAPRNSAVLAAARTQLASLDRNRAVLDAAQAALTTANLPIYAEANRTARLIVEQYAQLLEPTKRMVELYTRLKEPADRLAESLNLDAVHAALREFDGTDWFRLGRRLDTVVGVQTVIPTTEIPVPTVVVEPEVRTETETGPVPKPAWRAQPLVAWATFAVAFYITLGIATYTILGPEAWHELRDDVAAVLGVLGFFIALDQANRR